MSVHQGPSGTDRLSSQTYLVLREDLELCFVARTQEVDYPTFLQALAECLVAGVQMVHGYVVGLIFVQSQEPFSSSSYCAVAGTAKGPSGVEAWLEARQVDGIPEKNRPADGQGRHSMEGI